MKSVDGSKGKKDFLSRVITIWCKLWDTFLDSNLCQEFPGENMLSILFSWR